MVEVTGLTAGTLAVRIGMSRPPLLRAAVFAQAADLTTFAFIFEGPGWERNPLAHALYEAARGLLGVGGDQWAVSATALLLIGMKLGLVAYLVWASPILGRYRGIVLVVAILAGIVGAVSNIGALRIFMGPTA